jgi:hypothetical protein
MKRTELKRSSWLPRGGGLARTAMKATRSKGARRQDVLRRSAYVLVDLRSYGFCEMEMCLNLLEQHHHRRPRRAGGSTDPTTETAANLLGLCGCCHADIESNRERAYEHGWLVRAGHDPAATPVLLHAGWVLLNDEGTYTPTKETL